MSYPQAVDKLSTGYPQAINLQPGTKAYAAYKKGQYAAKENKSESDCPYITGRVQMLKSWWLIGYRSNL